MATLKEVKSVIDNLLERAEKFEIARDNSEYESEEYWHHHDDAMELIRAAETLMP